MANDWDELAAMVGSLATDEEFVQECWADAVVLVDKRIGAVDVLTVPTEIVDRSYREVGADLYWRRSARNGIVGINSMDSTPIRINRDPIMACEALLSPFLTPGFA